ncbi:MAG: DUF1127 domain-containing protein [Amylibacter sp.]|nr:DUF1127 domain-containing protein [Amylibacter sp.]|tara:strand:+ start:1131 stop:1331 length:201 start_codon:yes stop_codon:yes gene_type:complete
MANFVNTSSQPLGSITIFRVASLLEAAFTAVIRRHQSRKTKTALSKLTERELKDIGLTRGDINNLF